MPTEDRSNPTPDNKTGDKKRVRHLLISIIQMTASFAGAWCLLHLLQQSH